MHSDPIHNLDSTQCDTFLFGASLGSEVESISKEDLNAEGLKKVNNYHKTTDEIGRVLAHVECGLFLLL